MPPKHGATLLLFVALGCVSTIDAGFFRYKWPKEGAHAESPGIAERLQTCEELRDALRTFFDDYILQQVGVEDKENLRRRVKVITGVDFHSNRQLTRLACKLTDVKNLQQLARVLKLPLSLVVKYYNLFIDMVEEHGGPEGMARLVDLWEVTVPAAKQVGLPHWPINCSYELAYDFFANVVHDFGKDFIMDFLRPYATEKLEMNNIGTFVKDLLASTSIEDFAIRVGLNPDILQFFQEDLEIYTSDSYPFEKTMEQARAEVILARALDKLGLLDLKLRRRKSPGKNRKYKNNPSYPTGSEYATYSGSGDRDRSAHAYRNNNGGGNNQQRYGIYYDTDYLQGYGNGGGGSGYYNRGPAAPSPSTGRNDFEIGSAPGAASPYNSNANGGYYGNRDYEYRKYADHGNRGRVQNNYDYYSNRNPSNNNNNRYVYPSNNRQLQRYFNNNKNKGVKNQGKTPQYQGGFGQEKLLSAGSGSGKNENPYSDDHQGAADDAPRKTTTTHVPKHLAYQWNTKPKENTNKSPYLYYG